MQAFQNSSLLLKAQISSLANTVSESPWRQGLLFSLEKVIENTHIETTSQFLQVKIIFLKGIPWQFSG